MVLVLVMAITPSLDMASYSSYVLVRILSYTVRNNMWGASVMFGILHPILVSGNVGTPLIAMVSMCIKSPTIIISASTTSGLTDYSGKSLCVTAALQNTTMSWGSVTYISYPKS